MCAAPLRAFEFQEGAGAKSILIPHRHSSHTTLNRRLVSVMTHTFLEGFGAKSRLHPTPTQLTHHSHLQVGERDDVLVRRVGGRLRAAARELQL